MTKNINGEKYQSQKTKRTKANKKEWQEMPMAKNTNSKKEQCQHMTHTEQWELVGRWLQTQNLLKYFGF